MELLEKDIESKKAWDAFVVRNAPQALFQSWEWGEVEKKLSRMVWRFGWFDGQECVAVAQVLKTPAKRGTFLHVRHGPVVTDKKYWKCVIEDLAARARKEHALFLRVSPQLLDTHDNQSLLRKLSFVPAPIHAMDAEVCWVLGLTPSEEELMAGMRKTTRYEIRRATKLGVTVRKSRDIRPFQKLYDATSERHRFVQHTGVKEELENMDTELYIASYEGKDIASALIVYFNGEAIYHHGASLSSKIPASYLVQWDAIREAKRRGMKLYNFWGIAPDDNESHPWRGLTVFKKGFGGYQITYIHAHDLPISRWYMIPKAIETVRKKLKGY